MREKRIILIPVKLMQATTLQAKNGSNCVGFLCFGRINVHMASMTDSVLWGIDTEDVLNAETIEYWWVHLVTFQLAEVFSNREDDWVGLYLFVPFRLI